MLALKCSSEMDLHRLVSCASKLGNCLLLSPGKSYTQKELEAAFFLARASFGEKSNLSDKLSNEALMFLACETNFSSAIRKIGAKRAKDFILVLEKNVPIAKVRKELALSSAKRMALGLWGKKSGFYYEGELAVERMALARIRN